jgi:hypothetical protein
VKNVSGCTNKGSGGMEGREGEKEGGKEGGREKSSEKQ